MFPFLYLHLAVVFDACSRMPLAARVFLFEPSAKAMLALVLQAVARHGKPRHFVSDQGDQFTAGLFRGTLKALGIRQRFGALYQHGSIALVERFFRSLKEDLHLGKKSRRSGRPWSIADFERRLVPALIRYSYCRPHSALEGRIPAEVFFGIPDQRPLTNLAPRGRPDEPDLECPVEIAFLDPDNRALPILVPKAA